MATAAQPYYVTTAIAYPNGAPHIGHVYEAIATDAIARFHRLDGRDVRFLTGTDEHGLKMAQTAAREGVPPLDWATRNAERFRAMDERYGVSFDRFIRTTDADHYAASQELWRRMKAAGDIYLGKYEGWYSVRDEAYFDESETTLGEDGSRKAPTGAPVEWVVEESYFFRLSAYQDRLLKLYEEQPGFVGPDFRRNEVVAFVKRGLNDLSISRTTFDWGVPVPDDPKHVMYVWVDALTNYLTGAGFPDEASDLRRFWPADLHVIGKDIIRFHTVYWPAFLMSAGLALPKRVFAHGFVNNRGEKMSKSVGNVIDPFTFADAYGVDAIRYFLLRDTPFGQDGNYTHETIVGRINADLANDLGNLAQRSLSMIAKNCEGRAPSPGPLASADEAVLAAVDGLGATVRAAVGDVALHAALAAIWSVIAETNRYFANAEPWALKKTDPERMGTVLYVTAESVRNVAILTQPFMPTASAKLLDLLAVPEDARSFASLGGAGRLAPGATLPAPQGVFPRYVEPEAAA
ncbi:methionine--tRNA ligase [Methylopila turkensis]|uniref:Methionine--tRNA ligase n=1 Tax=Methylopila turkensis TaxID=1437816 RepID=A0A9W6JS05_9HYPH|nr:methionine--tRNA ligase [Methylopila turkensis]GLK80975.1 methionine--tRNA ligase [Methylopila turkensis]